MVLVSALSTASEPAAAQDRAACLAAYDSGQAARDERKLTRVRREFTICASDACPAVLRKDCLEWLRDNDAVLPTIVLRVVDPTGHDEVRVKVELDGAPLIDTLDGKPLAVDPGPHTLRFRADGYTPVDERVVIAEGEKNRFLVVRLPARPGAAPASRRPAEQGSLIGPLVAGGAAVVALGAATLFWATAIGDGDALRDQCGSPPACAQGDVDAVHAKLVVGDVLAGVGLVAGAVAVYLLVTRKPHATTPSRLLAPRGLSVRF